MYTLAKNDIKDKRSLSLIVTDTLRYSILAGKITSGEKIKENDLAEEMCVSRAMIREAFIRLEAEGIIEKKVNRSAYVKKFDRQEMIDVFEYRRVLEIAAAERILDNGKDISAELERQLRIMKMKTFGSENSYTDLIRLDMDFHRYIVRKCENMHTIRSWELLCGQMLVILYAVAKLKYKEADDLDADMQETHLPILEVFKTLDKERVKAVFTDHIGFGYFDVDSPLEAALKNEIE